MAKSKAHLPHTRACPVCVWLENKKAAREDGSSTITEPKTTIMNQRRAKTAPKVTPDFKHDSKTDLGHIKPEPRIVINLGS